MLFVRPATRLGNFVQVRIESADVEPRHLRTAIKGCELKGQFAGPGKLLRELDYASAIRNNGWRVHSNHAIPLLSPNFRCARK